MNNKIRRNDRIRLIFQAISFAFHNGYIRGWVKDGLYTGTNKSFCVPGLNCYSCPGAVGSCPIGSLQAIIDSGTYKISLYVLGFIGLVGVLCGRLVCGWLCPFGLIQDLLYRIPLFKKIKTLPGHRYLKWLKYVVLGLFVILLPMTVMGEIGMGKPWFCEWICPSGTLLGGIPQVIMVKGLRDQIGFRFAWKFAILLLVLILSVKLSRPFCKYLCPLGAMYGLCNPVSTYRLKIDAEKCVECGACAKVCPMAVETWKAPNSIECIRCGKCMATCPQEAISSTWNNAADWKPKQKQTDEMACEIRIPGPIRRVIAAILSLLPALGVIVILGYQILDAVEGILFTSLMDAMKEYIYFFPCIIAASFMIALSIKIFRSLGDEKRYEDARSFSVRTFWMTMILCIGLNFVLAAMFGLIIGGIGISSIYVALLILFQATVTVTPVLIIFSLAAMLLMKQKKRRLK